MFVIDDMEVSTEAFKCYLLGKSFIRWFEELFECNDEFKRISLIENINYHTPKGVWFEKTIS